MSEPGRPLRVGSWPGPSYGHNPFVRILCEGLEANGVEVVDVSHPARVTPGSLDVLQLHWAEQVFWTSPNILKRFAQAWRTVRAIRRHKAAGTRVAWIVHNLQPHGMGPSEKLIWPFLRRSFAQLANAIITLSPETAPVVERAYSLPAQSVRFIRHPSYPLGMDVAAARAALKISERTRLLTFFGTIRQNKGVAELMAAFRALNDADARLHVLGAAKDPAAIVSLTGGDPRVELDLIYVDREQIILHASAADAVVIPLADQLHSGSLVDALSLGAPIITARTPFSQGLQSDIGLEWVHLYSGVLNAGHLTPNRPAGRPDLSLYEPAVVARALVGIYEEVAL